jgi:hypothetical protein
MKTAIGLEDVTIFPVVEQQGPFFDAMEFFPMLTKELLEENRWWLQPTFVDPVSERLVLCVQSFVISCTTISWFWRARAAAGCCRISSHDARRDQCT